MAQEVSEPASYGFLGLTTSEEGDTHSRRDRRLLGLSSPHAVFYVGVPNVEAALRRAEDLGEAR